MPSMASNACAAMFGDGSRHAGKSIAMKYLLLGYIFLNGIFYREFSHLGIPMGGAKVYITELTLLAIIVMWIFQIASSGKIIVMKGVVKQWSILLLFAVWAIIALTYSNHENVLFSMREISSVYYALFAMITIMLFRCDRDFDLLVRVLIISAVISVVVIFSRYLLGHSLEITTTDGVARYGNYETVGILFPIAWLMGQPFQLKKVESMLRIIVILISAGVVIMLVQHRSATISVIVTIAVMALHRTHKEYIGMGLCIIFTFILLLLMPHADNLIQGTLDRLESIGAPSADANISWRLAVWIYVIDLMSDIQYLIGVGWGMVVSNFTFAGNSYGNNGVLGIHNSLVFYFFHLGAVGLALFLSLISSIYFRALRTMRKLRAIKNIYVIKLEGEIRALFATNLGILVFSFFNVVLAGPYMGSVFWITLGMVWLKARKADMLLAQHREYISIAGGNYYAKEA